MENRWSVFRANILKNELLLSTYTSHVPNNPRGRKAPLLHYSESSLRQSCIAPLKIQTFCANHSTGSYSSTSKSDLRKYYADQRSSSECSRPSFYTIVRVVNISLKKPIRQPSHDCAINIPPHLER